MISKLLVKKQWKSWSLARFSFDNIESWFSFTTLEKDKHLLHLGFSIRIKTNQPARCGPIRMRILLAFILRFVPKQQKGQEIFSRECEGSASSKPALTKSKYLPPSVGVFVMRREKLVPNISLIMRMQRRGYWSRPSEGLCALSKLEFQGPVILNHSSIVFVLFSLKVMFRRQHLCHFLESILKTPSWYWVGGSHH